MNRIGIALSLPFILIACGDDLTPIEPMGGSFVDGQIDGPSTVPLEITPLHVSIHPFADAPDGAVVSTALSYECPDGLFGRTHLTVFSSWGAPPVTAHGVLSCPSGQLHEVVRLGGGAYAMGYVTAKLEVTHGQTGESLELVLPPTFLEEI
jgi:hypothetical protein